MAFTIADAKALAETWFEEVLNSDDILVWGNEFLRREVSNKLWQEETLDYDDSVAKTFYELPANFFRIVSVVRQDIPDIELNSAFYMVNNGRIRFTTDGSYTITYKAYPASVEATTDEFPLPDAFIYPLAEFLIFKYFNVELDDEDCKSAAIEYEARVNASLKTIYDEMQIDTSTESFRVQMKW